MTEETSLPSSSHTDATDKKNTEGSTVEKGNERESKENAAINNETKSSATEKNTKDTTISKKISKKKEEESKEKVKKSNNEKAET